MKIAIFDFDDTLVHEGFVPPIECNDAYNVIKLLYNKGYTICIATLNEYAGELCEQTSFYKFIDSIIAVNTDDAKDYHLKTILNYYKCDPRDCILFDDRRENVDHARELGMKAKLVNEKKGVTMKNALVMIKNRH